MVPEAGGYVNIIIGMMKRDESARKGALYVLRNGKAIRQKSPA